MYDSDRSDPFPHWIVAAIGFVAVLDVTTSRVTLPVLYTIPILLYALSHRRRWLWLLAVLSVASTFVGLTIKAHYFPLPMGQRMLGWRLLNRSFASGAVCLTAAMLYYWVGFCNVIKDLATKADKGAHSDDSNAFRQVLHSVTALLATIIGVALTACILVADIISPTPANLPILYAVPLVLVALWMESKRVMWSLLPFMLIFTAIGQFWTPPMVLPASSLRLIMINRVFAVGALIVVAIILHFRLGKEPVDPVEQIDVTPAVYS